MTYADLKGVSAVPNIYKKQGLPEGVNTTMMFNLDKFDETMFDSLSENIKETIKKSPEYRSIGEQSKTYQEAFSGSVADMDDDVPF